MKQPILIIFICIMLSALIFRVFTWPKIVEFRGLYNNATILEGNLKETRDHFNKAEQNYDELQRNNKTALEKIDNSLPEEIFVPELNNHFQAITNSAGMILESITTNKPSVGIIAPPGTAASSTINFLARLNIYPMTMKVTGSYSSFKHFLFLVERSNKLIDISKFSFDVPDKPNLPLTFTMDTKTYSVK